MATALRDHIHAFEIRLDKIDVGSISPELYCRKYLSHLLVHKKYYLHIYADILQKLIQHSPLPQNKISIIDYGAGNGLLGIFAKFCGFGEVWINDIDPRFLLASQKLAADLEIAIDGFIGADIQSVKSYLKNKVPAAIIGTDIIEHIYDLPDFFSTIREINPSIISVFNTGSNPSNYFKVRGLKKLHLKDELDGGTPDDRVLFGDVPLPAFLLMRQQMIRKFAPALGEPAISELSKRTRGLIEADIQKAVRLYNDSGQMPIVPTDSNTCNPINGSWTERLLPNDTYISLFKNAGFTCKIYAGFYNSYQSNMGSFVKKLLNGLITIIGKKISPYIVIVGYKK